MEKNNNTLGQTLKDFRLKAFPEEGLRRVAAEVGIDYAHLFRIEAGQYTPSDESLMKLLDAYKVTDPAEKFKVFHLARLTTTFQKIIDEAAKKEHHREAVAGVLYRKDKKNKK